MSKKDQQNETETAGTTEELQQHGKPNVRILYEKTEASFINQVIVNSGRDQIILDFSTGIISDHASGNHVLPIQHRLAMTPANAASLVNTLGGVLRQMSEANQKAAEEAADAPQEGEVALSEA
ncbi:MAG: hypothetical protein CMO55_28660 [Verrucomicrobiales bacterium]|nr:hypothetical protein [Verrucomicrobiales bacterium]